jgi:WD40 repeat protein
MQQETIRTKAKKSIVLALIFGLLLVVTIAERVAEGQQVAPATLVADRLPLTSQGLAVAWSGDGNWLAAASAMYTLITVFDSHSNAPVNIIHREVATRSRLALSSNGNYLLTSVGKKATDIELQSSLTLWNARTGEVVKEIPSPYSEKLTAVNMAVAFAIDPSWKRLAFIPNGRQTRVVAVADTSEWNIKYTLSVAPDRPESVAISADASQLAVGTTSGEIMIFDLETRQLKTKIDAYPAKDVAIGALSFSPTGEFVVSGSGAGLVRNPNSGARQSNDLSSLRIWKTSDGSPVRSFPLIVDRGAVHDVSWSPHASLIAVASDDHTIRLWNADDGSDQTVAELQQAGFGVSFSPDGSRVATVDARSVIVAHRN